ncbi:unnamed protein product [Trichogramma brassicae]|uniref:Uncharacterized protein n=1 Tax=Trichogramma brassicae TaxID=86971 RepID=A0A6H5IRC3_9HYME|nr:unnamed protein product [Trichogramma brassicae]
MCMCQCFACFVACFWWCCCCCCVVVTLVVFSLYVYVYTIVYTSVYIWKIKTC